MAAKIRQCGPMLSALSVFGLAIGVLVLVTQAQEPGSKVGEQPKALDEKVVQAWKAAGAEVGWRREGPRRDARFVADGQQAKQGDLPAFRLKAWPSGVMSKLPDPGQAFGLDLFSVTEVTDAELKELAALKSLQALNMTNTEVTDAGLKELAGLKSLQTLDLCVTKVTDAGLKELARLKSLQSLDLRGTTVTDAGLKELAGLNSLQSLSLKKTQVTDAGVRDLQKALPGCRITQ